MPSIAAAAVVLDGDRVLLTMREDFEVWCLPSGQVEPGESVSEAAVREVHEETGYRVRLGELVGVYSSIGDWPDVHACTFVAAPVSAEPDPLETPDEVLAVEWFRVDDLPDRMMWWHTQRIRDAVAGRRGLVRSHEITSALGRLTRAELYAARDASGLGRWEFFQATIASSEETANTHE